MTKEQIKSYIEDHGYKLDKWDSFSKIPIIRLYSITSILTDSNRLLRFNSSKNRLEFVLGKYDKNGNFIAKDNSTSNYKPSGFVTFSAIAGFVRSDVATNVFYSRRPFYTKKK